MNPTEQYIHDRDEQVRMNLDDRDLHVYAQRFTAELVRTNYTKNFTWMGIPILQFPTDLMVMQELIWKIQPDYIIETGVAFGGMSKFYSSILENMGEGFGIYCIDIDIRPHAKKALKDASFIHLIEKSSTDPEIVFNIKTGFSNFGRLPNVLISLDSNHTHDHVLQELRLYSPLVSFGSYIVVFDTSIEEYWHIDIRHQDRPWGIGNNPATATKQFLSETDEFVVDREIEQRALITSAPGGWLKRIKEAS